MKELESAYKPQQFEQKWTNTWIEKNIFHAQVNSSKQPFSIVIPPPNITGNLHMGHALNNTIQDILIRWKKMQGLEVCWFPGTDHAGIATQVVVERELRKEGKTRFELGRDAFVARVWEWRNQYGRIIDDQLKKLGVSCDWSRYAFTMDEVRARAVRDAFVKLYQKDLIYRDEYIVNWCQRCQTALSDLEVEHSEEDNVGTIYHLRYPLVEPVDGIESITVATGRPETMLGDVAVAVNPNDSRYKKLIGKTVILPLVGRKLKIIADEWADPTVGSGAVKITPAHDPNDFEVGRRHHLPIVKVIDFHGKIALFDKELPEERREFLKKYQGMDRFDARKLILEDLKQEGFLVKEEPWVNNPGRCSRSGDIIEPMVSLQWFVRMKNLAQPSIDAVRSSKIRFHPEKFSKLYFDWMENIRDWCVSRQLWWGHQIPAWYCTQCDKAFILKSTETDITILPGAHPIVALEKPVHCPKCSGNELIQDPDVLDTWFSSGLWPLSTMGWPEETPELNYFYPTSVLSTGRDIINLWVGRMITFGLELRNEIPFHEIYIHPTILDKEGRRMSKSKGTGVDPLELIQKFGADATRFGMILMSQSQDVRFNEEKIEQSRNFANKIWNATRFILLNISEDLLGSVENIQLKPVSFYDYWIAEKLGMLVTTVTTHLEQYEFGPAASAIYDFFWEDFCDWYVELSKLDLQSGDESAKRRVGQILFYVIASILKTLHPFMPFLTEEIWSYLAKDNKLLIESPWPMPCTIRTANDSMANLIEMVRAIRNLKAEIGLKQKEKFSVGVICKNKSKVTQMTKELLFLTQASDLMTHDDSNLLPKKAISSQISLGTVYVPLEGVVDIDAEVRRLNEENEKITRELDNVRRRLSDGNFVQKAKPEILNGAREKEMQVQEKLQRIQERIALLRGE